MLAYYIEFFDYFAQYFFLVSLFIGPCIFGTLLALFWRNSRSALVLHGVAAIVSGLVGFGLVSVGMNDAFFSPNSMGNLIFLVAPAYALVCYIACYALCWLLFRKDLGKTYPHNLARGRQWILIPAISLTLLGLGTSAAFVAPGADAVLARSSEDREVLEAIFAVVGTPRDLEDVYIARSLASNQYLSADAETKMALHPHEEVRWALANRQGIHKDAIALLAKDCSVRIRKHVLKLTTSGNETTQTTLPTNSDCGAQSLPSRALR
jgi:hypothetical protein